MYLSGSLALGDFDLQSSDIDFVVLTSAALPADRIAALDALHRRFDVGPSPWAGKIEAVYIPPEALQPAPPAPYPQVEKDRPLLVEPLESGSISNATFCASMGSRWSGRPCGR